jgi:hypothetical protein
LVISLADGEPVVDLAAVAALELASVTGKISLGLALTRVLLTRSSTR